MDDLRAEVAKWIYEKTEDKKVRKATDDIATKQKLVRPIIITTDKDTLTYSLK